jgi:hypothetical protein
MNISKILSAAAVSMLAAQVPVRAQTVCNDATITGRYASHGQGWVGIGTVEAFSPEVVVGVRTFDGKGTFTGSGHQAIAGLSRSFTITGTYSVAADCTVTIHGTATSPSAPTASEANTWFGVVTDAGNRIYTTRINNGATTFTEFERITSID